MFTIWEALCFLLDIQIIFLWWLDFYLKVPNEYNILATFLPLFLFAQIKISNKSSQCLKFWRHYCSLVHWNFLSSFLFCIVELYIQGLCTTLYILTELWKQLVYWNLSIVKIASFWGDYFMLPCSNGTLLKHVQFAMWGWHICRTHPIDIIF